MLSWLWNLISYSNKSVTANQILQLCANDELLNSLLADLAVSYRRPTEVSFVEMAVIAGQMYNRSEFLKQLNAESKITNCSKPRGAFTQTIRIAEWLDELQRLNG